MVRPPDPAAKSRHPRSRGSVPPSALEFCPRADLELGVDPAQVRLYDLRAHEESGRNGAIGEAGGYELGRHDLGLSPATLRAWVARVWRSSPTGS